MYNKSMFETPDSTTSETLEAQERLFFQKLKQHQRTLLIGLSKNFTTWKK